MNVSNMYVGAAAQNPTGLQLLGSTTLSIDSASLDVSSIPYRNHYFIVIATNGFDVADQLIMTYNNITSGNRYCSRISVDGAADTAGTNAQNFPIQSSTASTYGGTAFILLSNFTGHPKRGTLESTFSVSSDASSAPHRCAGALDYHRGDGSEFAITQITLSGAASHNIKSGSYIAVYGAN